MQSFCLERAGCLLAISLLLFGCTTAEKRIDERAAASHFEKLLLPGAAFLHVSYFKPGDVAKPLHVYVEHDGTPWTTPTRPAADPTPRVPLMLEVMLQDAAPVLYLGRPCYFGFAGAPPCAAVWWTHRRFSSEVVDSMSEALRNFLSQRPDYPSIEFYGYSGGGVIVTLMAGRFPQTTRLVTVAAPLDIDAWARFHGYARLDGSLNPIRDVGPMANVRQLHLAGSRDTVVPAGIVESFAATHPGAEVRVVQGFDHYCCWDRIWKATVLTE